MATDEDNSKAAAALAGIVGVLATGGCALAVALPIALVAGGYWLMRQHARASQERALEDAERRATARRAWLAGEDLRVEVDRHASAQAAREERWRETADHLQELVMAAETSTNPARRAGYLSEVEKVRAVYSAAVDAAQRGWAAHAVAAITGSFVTVLRARPEVLSSQHSEEALLVSATSLRGFAGRLRRLAAELPAARPSLPPCLEVDPTVMADVDATAADLVATLGREAARFEDFADELDLTIAQTRTQTLASSKGLGHPKLAAVLSAATEALDGLAELQDSVQRQAAAAEVDHMTERPDLRRVGPDITAELRAATEVEELCRAGARKRTVDLH